MTEWVREVDLRVVWDANVPDAVLMTDDGGQAALALNAPLNAEDQRAVVLCWSGARYRLMSPPNDEASNGHRLYEKGLKDILWIGEVQDSELIASLEEQNRVHPSHDPARFVGLHHHVVLTKEVTIEVVARSFDVKRIAGPTGKAAHEAFLP